MCYWGVHILIVKGEPATRDVKLEKQNVSSADLCQRVLGWVPQLLMIFSWPSLRDCISFAEVLPLFFGSLDCRAKEKEIEGKPIHCKCLLELKNIIILSSLFLLLLLAKLLGERFTEPVPVGNIWMSWAFVNVSLPWRRRVSVSVPLPRMWWASECVTSVLCDFLP